jgi:WD40 repeat protein
MDWTSRRMTLPLDRKLKVRTLAFSPDGKKLAAAGGEPPRVFIVDTSTTYLLKDLPVHGSVLGISWILSSETLWLAVLWETGLLSFFHAENYREQSFQDFPHEIAQKNKEKKGYITYSPGLVATAAGVFGNIWAIDRDLSEIPHVQWCQLFKSIHIVNIMNRNNSDIWLPKRD